MRIFGETGIRYPGNIDYWYYIGSDNRKKVSFEINHYNNWSTKNYRRYQELYTGVSYRPVDALKLSLGTNISFNKNKLQYVDTKSFGSEDRYLTATIDQKTYSLEMRFTLMLTPNLSLQFWGQPFLSQGSYSQFKMVTDAENKEFEKRFKTYTQNQIIYNRESENYEFDENQDQVVDYEVENPDFNFVEFRSNMVLRWEYTPGSTLFLVWNQNRSDNLPLNRNYRMNSLSDGLWNTYPNNIFLIKYTYRFIL